MALRASLARFLGAATVVGTLLCAGVLGYGLLQGPPAPIRQVQEGYRDRYGNAYTAGEYARFLLWKRVLLSSFATTFIAGFAWVAVDRKQRGSRELSSEERETLQSAMQRVERILPDVADELRAREPLNQRQPEKPDSDRADQTG
jgi:hypothetical protein